MKILKWIGGILVLLVIVIIISALSINSTFNKKKNRIYSIEPSAVTILSDSTSLARGRHLAVTRGCTDCHGDDFSGATIMEAPPIAMIYGSNLTTGKGGKGAEYTDLDMIRAIRHGVNKDGNPIMLMPSEEYYYLSDQDLSALIAYTRSVPPVDNTPPKIKAEPIGKMLVAMGKMPLFKAEVIDHEAERPESPMPGVTIAYGEYLAYSCIGCHGKDLSGGTIVGGDPSWPPASNLTPHEENGIGTWNEDNFFTAMQAGKRPDGASIDPSMPWMTMGQMTTEELSALWKYLQKLPAVDNDVSN